MRTRLLLSVLSIFALTASGCVNLLRLDVDSAGAPANATTTGWDLSADGKYAVFSSTASNLGNNPNGVSQIWRRNTQSGVTELVSRSAGCTEPCAGGNGNSVNPAISADGRYVAFETAATNLLPGGETNGVDDIYRTDMDTGLVAGVSYSNGHSRSPSISDDGDRIAFESASSITVAGDTNGVVDIFVRTMSQSPPFQRISVGPNGVQADAASSDAHISGDGQVVAFRSNAPSLGGPAGSFYFHEAGVTTHFFTNPGGWLNDIDRDGDRFALVRRGTWLYCKPFGCIPYATNEPDFLDRSGQTLMNVGGLQLWSVEILGLVDHQPQLTADGTQGVVFTSEQFDFLGAIVAVELDGISLPEIVASPPAGHSAATEFALSADGQVISATFDGPGVDSHDASFTHALEITAVTTDVPLVAGGTAQLSITGDHFGASSDDLLNFYARAGFTVDNVVRVDEQHATATVTAPANVAPGGYPLYASRFRWRYFGGSECTACIVVTS